MDDQNNDYNPYQDDADLASLIDQRMARVWKNAEVEVERKAIVEEYAELRAKHAHLNDDEFREQFQKTVEVVDARVKSGRRRPSLDEAHTEANPAPRYQRTAPKWGKQRPGVGLGQIMKWHMENRPKNQRGK